MRIVSLLPSATEIVCAIGLARRARRHHPRMRLPAGGRRHPGHDPERARPRHVVVARHPPAGHRVRPRRLVAVRAGRRGARRRGARPHPDPGAVPGLRGQLPRGQRGRPGDRRRHHRRVARADLDRGHLQHDHHGRRDDRGGGRRGRPRRDRCASGSVRSKPRSSRGATPAAGRPASSASNGSIRRSHPVTGSPSRSGGRVAGSCSARTATDPSRRRGTRSPRWTPRCSC